MGHSFHHVNNEDFKRGSLIAYNPENVSATFFETPCPQFEIGVARIASGLDEVSIISAYRSPSMKERDGNVIDYMEALVETIAAIDGKIILLGDLNLQAGRQVFHRHDESILLGMLESVGLHSAVRGITHTSIHGQNQLDYCYTNIEDIGVSLVDGFASDHRAIEVIFDLKLNVTWVPETITSTFERSFDDKLFNAVVREQVDKIIAADLDTGEALVQCRL